jgi:hypothetical protein
MVTNTTITVTSIHRLQALLIEYCPAEKQKEFLKER